MSSETKGICYIETKNLDGESNLKHKEIPKSISKHLFNEHQLFSLQGFCKCEEPNDQLYTFEGILYLDEL